MKKYLILFVLIIIQGCSSGDDDNGTTADADVSDSDTTTDIDTPDVDTADNDTTLEALTFIEEQLVGKWVYYHNFDASYRYLIFMADRTGCEFEITASDDRVDYKPYGHWELLPPSEPDIFTISVTRSDDVPATTNYTYYSAETRILRGSSSSGEDMYPGTTDWVCD